MSVIGIGHKAGWVVFGVLAVTFAISYFTQPFFRITESYGTLLAVGIALVAVGFTANLIAAFQMLRPTSLTGSQPAGCTGFS